MKTLVRAITVSLALLLICGVIYPLGMTAVSQLLFNRQANGSVYYYNGKPVGSELIGQDFSDARYFHGRISSVNYNTYTEKDKNASANGAAAYTGVASGSANLAPSNPELVKRVKKDIDEFLKANPGVRKEDIPADLLTSSGSGLDPHISPEAAKIQIPAISGATGISQGDLEKIVADCTEGRMLGIFGEPRVNILKANAAITGKLK